MDDAHRDDEKRSRGSRGGERGSPDRGVAPPSGVPRDSVSIGSTDLLPLIDLFDHPVWLCGPDGLCVSVNAAWCELTGRPADKEKGNGWRRSVAPEDRERVVREQREALRLRIPFEVEFRLRCRDGGHRWVVNRGAPLLDEERAFAGYLCSCYDVSDRHRMEEALKQSEERLRRSRGLESLGRLAGGVAHDFNNLLTAISGYTELLLERLDPEGPSWRHATEVERAVERARSLTAQLLAFTRRRVREPRRVDLSQSASALGRMLGRLIGEDVEVVTRLEPRPWPVLADPAELDQVCLNLALMAREAMPRGGTLVIETSNRELAEDESRRHGLPLAGPCSVLTVRAEPRPDPGTGVAPRAFEPPEVGDGPGPGLGLVREIAARLGGALAWVPEVDGGGHASVFFPRVETLPPAGGETEAGKLRGDETILVVEDDETVRELLREVLERQGYEVLVADGGDRALELARRHDGPIHLVLSDVVLPGVGGRELSDRLSALRPETGVLLMSGYADEPLLRHAGEAAASLVVAKPFRPLDLSRRVREVLDEPGRSGSRTAGSGTDH